MKGAVGARARRSGRARRWCILRPTPTQAARSKGRSHDREPCAVSELDAAQALPVASSVAERAGESRPTTGARLSLSGRIRRADLLALIFCAGCAVLIFRLSLFDGWTFAGVADRLNTAPNIRLFETDAIRSRGVVPTWSDDQFMGYDSGAVHWLLPGFTPVPYLL